MPADSQQRKRIPGSMPPDSMIRADEIAVALGGDAPPDLRELLDHARHARFRPQEVLYRQGNDSATVYFVTEGLLKLVTHLPNGRARIVRLHHPGSVLGLSGLLSQHHEHTAAAVTPVTALRMPLKTLQALRQDNPALYIHLTEYWHEYLRDADTWITEFSTGPIRARVARLLSYLAGFEPHTDGRHVQLLTCEEMGSILGVTAESVSRILAEFKRRHILDHRHGEPAETFTADTDRLHDIAME